MKMGKQTGSFKAPSPLFAVFPSTEKIERKVSSAILVATSATGAVLPFLPYDMIGKNRVPTIFFKGHPSTFHAFIISIMFAFSGSFSSLFLPNRPKMARICRFYSMVAAVSALLILLFAISSSL
ncbi:unnamed protein product [Ilex paraguariensis]|uniref:NADH dehydrogenase subunit 6 n=1 Tax=Ilex paraguariensis TaxID=185542 RepID=A0ABC8S2K2_9AQUA